MCYMMSISQIMLALCLCLFALFLGTEAFYNDGLLRGYPSESDLTDENFVREDRGAGIKGMRRVAFPCNGDDHLARCLHGGRGPRKTMTKAGRFCVCLCSTRWVGPECGYSAESLKKRYPWGTDKRASDLPWEKMAATQND